MRDIVAYLCQHDLINTIVCTGTCVVEDVMKSFTNFYDKNEKSDLKDFEFRGNILKGKKGYEKFEEFLNPILDRLIEQEKQQIYSTPSSIIKEIGKELKDPKSFI